MASPKCAAPSPASASLRSRERTPRLHKQPALAFGYKVKVNSPNSRVGFNPVSTQTACGLDESSWLGSAGAETVVSRRVAIRLGAQVAYAPPGRMVRLVESNLQNGKIPNAPDYVKPAARLATALLTWHL